MVTVELIDSESEVEEKRVSWCIEISVALCVGLLSFLTCLRRDECLQKPQ